MLEPRTGPRPAAEAGVVTEAVIRAADQLGVNAKSLSSVLGVSEATVSRMRRKDFLLERGSKPFELGVLFVRLFRSLDAIVGGDETVAEGLDQESQPGAGSAAAGKDPDHMPD